MSGRKTPVAQSAAGTVAERWSTIQAWLRANRPAALSGFNAPATAAAIAKAERDLKRTLPDDYKAFLRIHDGQDEFASFVGLGALLPIAKVVLAYRNIMGEPDPIKPKLAGKGVRAVDYSNGWIPITRSARGRDYLCIDLDPAPTGVSGQIVEYVVDDLARPRVATSFTELLATYFEKAKRKPAAKKKPK